MRKKAVAKLIRKGTVPAVSGNSDFNQSGTTNIITLYGEQLLMPNDDNSGSQIEERLSVDKLRNGGLSINLDATELASNHVQLKKAIEAASGIPFCHLMVKLTVCNSCGNRSGSSYLEMRIPWVLSYAADSLVILNNEYK
jgi:hypothetical protein